MKARIRPEPSDAQRQAILAALARSPGTQSDAAYRSAWRIAGLPAVGETGLDDPRLADPGKDSGA